MKKPLHTAYRLTALVLVCLMFVTSNAYAVAIGWGDTGENVRKIQQKLIQWGYMTGTADGVYGQKTYDAVVKFQKKYGVKADGVVGDATAALLGITLSGGSSGSGSSSTAAANNATADVDLLARLVYGEARGEPYKGKVAVAAVVLNRVKSASFPNTISGVIYQSGAFDVVKDGQIYMTPDADSIKAAKDAMNGWDPTNGCLYYYNPARATSSWIYTREVRIVIGKHYFCI